MRHTTTIILSLILLAALSGCASGVANAAVGDPVRGEQLYHEGRGDALACTTCHTLDGSPLVGPSHQGIGERAGTRVPGLSAADYIRQSIVDPSAYVVEGYPDAMFKDYAELLTPQDIDDLVAFLLTQ